MLFESLRRVRSRLANERKIKPRAVLPDKALMQMVRVRPSDADSLALVYGFGRVKLERYGAAFLDAIREFERGSEQIRAA
jgi:ATP-dependent DNA helicase RecQ